MRIITDRHGREWITTQEAERYFGIRWLKIQFVSCDEVLLIRRAAEKYGNRNDNRSREKIAERTDDRRRVESFIGSELASDD